MATQFLSHKKIFLNDYSQRNERQNHGMQRSGGGAFFGEINVNSRRPLIPDVIRLTLPDWFAGFRSSDEAGVDLYPDDR